MLTLVLTYRNRDLKIVNRCLNSLNNQNDKEFKLFLVDYGSSKDFSDSLKELSSRFTFTNYIYVRAQGQLWNKSRAINIALKQCQTPYFLMGDIDLVYHPDMISICKQLMLNHNVVYFKYGFLSRQETELNKSFFEYTPEFNGNEEVTGTTLYKTDILKSIHGYDEFYHGWGAEDTDVHLRLKNAGYEVYFYDSEILVKHQWHPKAYRSKSSTAPFHTTLEMVNHDYMMLQHYNKVSIANKSYEWGVLPNSEQIAALKQPGMSFQLTSVKNKFDAFLIGVFPFINQSATIIIKEDVIANNLKNKVKRALKKKYIATYTIEEVNNLLLGKLISDHRLASYKYRIDWRQKQIELIISPYGIR